MAATTKHELFVVDGSNIATEGRSTPSLEQLNDAVLAFIEAHPRATVTVVVDATFGHRIAKKETKAFDEAVANNELVTPPAGAVGRGDAFVLAIADRAKAGVLSNDSFQEFHGEYDWLFDEGRLIGGKPVPHVGWVFVKRSPVRGPKSRQAVRDASEDATGAKERANRRVRKKSASAPDESSADDAVETTETTERVPADDRASTSEPAPAPTKRGRRGRGRTRAIEPIGPDQQATIDAAKAVTAPREHVNDLMPFLEFVELHPVGTSCTVVVESYSSHGAYARVDDVLVYIPLRLMDDPAPRSARSALAIGEAITTVIVGYVPDRRSIDAALPHMAGDVAAAAPTAEQPAERPAAKKTAARKTAAKESATKRPAAKKTPTKRTPARKTPAKKTAAKAPAATKAPAEETAARMTAATSSTAKKTAAKATAAGRSSAKKTQAEKTAAKATTTKKAAAKTTAKKTAAKATASRRSPAKTTAAKRTAARKTAATERD